MDTSLVATPSGAPSSSAKSASFDHLLTSDILSDKARDLKSPFLPIFKAWDEFISEPYQFHDVKS